MSSLLAKASELYGLQLIIPGAIGRSVLADESLCWLATTHAVLFKYHDLDYSTEALCDLSLSHKVPIDDGRRLVLMARIRPVLEKTTESIAIQTTNLGQGVAALPDELKALKPHFLSPGEFSHAVHTIISGTDQDLLVRVEHCATDLLDWIYGHWPGKLTVGLENSIVYQGKLGPSAK